ncbi:hypothetical protein E0493_13970 [Roseomonas sp. M0104]|uniref:PepSY domain-containing protein n=1 Tax=Teichococcus coralli TaxID=2545983 RepID=A0A845BA07_9PROT|nr:hypothetical protein [Pseudoroseomonas coralli]MXP64453.1 hypothetical protein [Pseudoroseomonas coralli]
MNKITYGLAGLMLAFTMPAMAQSAGSGAQSGGTAGSHNGQQQQGASGQREMMSQQRVKQDLEQAGFTNVRVMPQSFLVRANDKQGRPVMMVINPDSITAVTAVGGSGSQGSAGSGGSGSGGSSGSGSSGSGGSSR